MKNNIINFLIDKKLTIAVAESYTGGLFSSMITSFADASKVFKGSIVAYNEQTKQNLLNISSTTINTYGTVSKECGIEMAKNIKGILNSDIGVSFTGNAGPKTSENKPVGLVYITIIVFNRVHSFELLLKGDRVDIQNQSVVFARDKIFDIII